MDNKLITTLERGDGQTSCSHYGWSKGENVTTSMQQDRPYVWQMVREAVDALGGKTTNTAVRNWIGEHYPGTNTNTIGCAIIACSVNHDSRIHYGENNQPRRADTQFDFLYRPERGHVERYVPDVHGVWEIYEKEDGRLGVRLVDAEPMPDHQEATGERGTAFAAEAHLRDYLAQHLDKIEDGLELYVDENESSGIEYVTPIGRIDILAVAGNGGFVVIELKVSRGPDSVAGQILRYRNWVAKHLADGKRVRGIIIAQHISERVKYSILADPDVSAMEYEISLELHSVDGP